MLRDAASLFAFRLLTLRFCVPPFSNDSAAPRLKGFLMVPRARESGGGCVITMIVHTDLGGNLPATILNRLSTSSPWRLVQRLRSAFESSDGKPSRAQKAEQAAAATAAIAADGEAS